MDLLALLSPFTDPNDRFHYPFINFKKGQKGLRFETTVNSESITTGFMVGIIIKKMINSKSWLLGVQVRYRRKHTS